MTPTLRTRLAVACAGALALALAAADLGAQRSAYRNANPDRLTVTERFTPVGPKTLRWTVTLNDPTTWTKPWTFSLPLTLNPSEPMMPHECHEGNYGLKNILSAARAEEKK